MIGVPYVVICVSLSRCGDMVGWMMYEIGFGHLSIVMLVCSHILKVNFLQISDHIRRQIPPPQPCNFSTHCDELSLVHTGWHNFTQARKVQRRVYGIERRVLMIGKFCSLVELSMPGQSL